MKIVFTLYAFLMYNTLTQAMLKELIWETIAYPRITACLCSIKDSPNCKLKKMCGRMFISRLKLHDKEYEKNQEQSHLRLFYKHNLFKTDKVGSISYSFSKGNAGYIKNIVLDDAWHNKGLGFLLMQHALHEMENQQVTHVTLAVGDWNKQAIALYEKCNFVVHERLTPTGARIMICTNLSHSRSKKN